jgi:hypothetical protein
MRRESSRLHQRAQLLDDALMELAALKGSETKGSETRTAPYRVNESVRVDAIATIGALLRTLRATADDLDRSGAVLQRYATDLAEGHELGRRAERRVEGAGLVLEGTRVNESWGPASAREAEHRRAQVPEVQARVDLATAHVGRARGRLEREVNRLTKVFMGHSQAAHSARPAPCAAPIPAPSRTRLGP